MNNFIEKSVKIKISVIFLCAFLLSWISLSNHIIFYGGASGVMVIVVGNGHGDTSSNPGRDWLHFT